MFPDGEMSVLRGEHRPAGEGLHHGDGLLVQGESYLAGHQRRVVRYVEHRVVHLVIDNYS